MHHAMHYWTPLLFISMTSILEYRMKLQFYVQLYILIVIVVLHHNSGTNSLLFVRLARQALRSHQYVPGLKTLNE